MPKRIAPTQLTNDEVAYLNQVINTGKRSARAIKRAQILLHSQAGKTPAQICEIVSTSVATVYLTRQHFREAGVQAAIEEKPRPGQPRRLSSEQEAALTVLACSDAPDGRAQWSVRLLADKAVEIGLVERVGRETIRRFLKKCAQAVAKGALVYRQTQRRVSSPPGRCAGPLCPNAQPQGGAPLL